MSFHFLSQQILAKSLAISALVFLASPASDAQHLHRRPVRQRPRTPQFHPLVDYWRVVCETFRTGTGPTASRIRTQVFPVPLENEPVRPNELRRQMAGERYDAGLNGWAITLDRMDEGGIQAWSHPIRRVQIQITGVRPAPAPITLGREVIHFQYPPAGSEGAAGGYVTCRLSRPDITVESVPLPVTPSSNPRLVPSGRGLPADPGDPVGAAH